MVNSKVTEIAKICDEITIASPYTVERFMVSMLLYITISSSLRRKQSHLSKEEFQCLIYTRAACINVFPEMT